MPSTQTLRLLSTFLAVTWMATLFYLSSQPMPEIDLGFTGQDKLVHLVAYGLLGALLLGALPLRTGGYSRGQMLLAAALATLYGISDEWHQFFVPGRTMDGLDVLADAIGALLGAWLLRRVVGKRPVAVRSPR
ncbi:MAG: VanZ family protein [Thiohalobacteraceae bacterium]|nr:VanZ family protein [Gammaproteobacteria bacterium]